MPPIEELKTVLFGTRVSPVWDLTEAIEHLGTIRSGKLTIVTSFPKHSFLDVGYSLDGGNMFKGELIPLRGTSEVDLIGVNNDMELVIKTNLRSPIGDIFPSETIEVHEIKVTLSDKPLMSWDGSKKTTLSWEVK